MKFKHLIIIFGTLVQVRAGFYTGCKGTVLVEYDNKYYGVELKCKTSEKYTGVGLQQFHVKELKTISEQEYKE